MTEKVEPFISKFHPNKTSIIFSQHDQSFWCLGNMKSKSRHSNRLGKAAVYQREGIYWEWL